MNLHVLLVQEPSQLLRNIQRWLDKATTYATEKKFDPSVLLNARLFPDQFALTRQIQSACDSAKGNAARLAGKDVPAHPDTETTVDELKARIDATINFLETIKESDFEGAETRKISLGWMQGKHVVGADYVRQFAIANFHFHVSHAYSILRHNGVPLGKMDYIGALNMQ